MNRLCEIQGWPIQCHAAFVHVLANIDRLSKFFCWYLFCIGGGLNNAIFQPCWCRSYDKLKSLRTRSLVTEPIDQRRAVAPLRFLFFWSPAIMSQAASAVSPTSSSSWRIYYECRRRPRGRFQSGIWSVTCAGVDRKTKCFMRKKWNRFLQTTYVHVQTSSIANSANY